MLFPTLAFGVFFLFVYFTAWSLDRENGRRKLFLLLASWFFYAQWDWRFVALLCAVAGMGTAMLYSVAKGSWEPWAANHIIRFGVLLVAMLVLSMVNLRWFSLNSRCLCCPT